MQVQAAGSPFPSRVRAAATDAFLVPEWGTGSLPPVATGKTKARLPARKHRPSFLPAARTREDPGA